MAVTERRLTLDEFLTLPEEWPALEYMDGVVTQKVAPQGEHSALEPDLAALINSKIRPGRLGRAFTELRSTYRQRYSPVPDISVYLWDRVPLGRAGRVANDFTDPPDVAIEIRSPEQTHAAQLRKCRALAESGVRATLLVDSIQNSITEVRAGQPDRVHRGADSIDLTDIIPVLRLTPAEVFATLLHN